MRQVLPGAAGSALWVAIVAANYLCGLACMTSTSRMMYAFARDGGLPGSRLLRRVSPRWQTPVPAIWTTAGLALASTVYAPAYSTLTTACVIFLYLSYVMPTAAGIRAYGRTWKTFGPFDLGGRTYRVLGAIALAGTAVLVWIGVQPPNEKALGVTVVTIALLLGAWRLGIRRVFRGPPQ
jgi:amino acid transporter